MTALELLYGLIGLVIPLVASRLGLPVLASRSPDLRDQIRQALIDLLKGVDPPKPAADEEVRQLLQSLVERK